MNLPGARSRLAASGPNPSRPSKPRRELLDVTESGRERYEALNILAGRLEVEWTILFTYAPLSYPSLHASFLLLAVSPWPVHQHVAVTMGGDKPRWVSSMLRQ